MRQQEKSICAVFMPMLPGYERIRAAVKDVFENSQLRMERLELEMPDPDWLLWVEDCLERAAMVLVDVTDNNPFVMYELGLTHAARLPVVFIVNESNSRVPATISSSRYIPYSTQRLEAFQRAVATQIDVGFAGVLRRKPVVASEAFVDSIVKSALQCLDDFRLHEPEIAVPTDLEHLRSSIRVALRRGEFDYIDTRSEGWSSLMLPMVVAHSSRISVMHAILRYAALRQSINGT